MYMWYKQTIRNWQAHCNSLNKCHRRKFWKVNTENIFILYLYVRLLTSGHIFDFSINLLHYVYMITIISCLLAYLLTIGNILSYLFYSGFVDPRFLWFSCTLAHLSGSPGSQSAPSIFIQHAYLPCVVI